jgi:hypothetical protein
MSFYDRYLLFNPVKSGSHIFRFLNYFTALAICFKLEVASKQLSSSLRIRESVGLQMLPPVFASPYFL